MLWKKFYYEDPEGDALSREACHPAFLKNMKAEFYYDCTDDFSPFGNDDGSDLLLNLEDHYRETKGKNTLNWLFDTIDGYGFKYKSRDCSKILDETLLKKIEAEDPYLVDGMDNSIIAAAFGQIKIAGKADREIRDLALTAIRRQLLKNKLFYNDSSEEHNQKLNQMLSDLEKS